MSLFVPVLLLELLELVMAAQGLLPLVNQESGLSKIQRVQCVVAVLLVNWGMVNSQLVEVGICTPLTTGHSDM